MNSTKLLSVLMLLLTFNSFSQNNKVKAFKHDISNNLDLRAVVSIFGESSSVEDFEFRLNHPSMQISNLDLNNDFKVDFLRIIETTENNSKLIILQAVIAKDSFQDVATIELNQTSKNKVQMQIVGNPFFYGNNYIYEPSYDVTPIIFENLLKSNYQIYTSNYNWKSLPNYFKPWNEEPMYRYVRNIASFIGYNNVCNFSYERKNKELALVYESIKVNHYEKANPTKSFNERNKTTSNRYELSKLEDSKIVNKNKIVHSKSNF